ncbi:DUF2334 domain-containing protein [Actinokineospora guangxiensis]|uniref:DUF2334 domain-containing protein n=1 Tax=Actinokineospora guangxiensis TaxID=1490288 RepID=A0ABW0EF86_9PSEU
MTARLLVSLSGIGARSLASADALADDLDRRGAPLSVLITPRGVDPDVADWARGRPVLAHGYDLTAPRGRGRKAEFAGLPAHEAGLRLTAAVAALDRAGLRTSAFAPPRWLASPGTLTALHALGFTRCADLLGVRDLVGGGADRGRVLAVGAWPEHLDKQWWRHAVVRAAGRSARRGGLVRLAADTGDLARPGGRDTLLAAVDAALAAGAAASAYPGTGTAPAGAGAVVPLWRQKVSFQELMYPVSLR